VDVLTVFGSAVLAAIYEMHELQAASAKGAWHGLLIHDRSKWILLVLLCCFCVTLIHTSRRLSLYAPKKLTSYLHEQRLSAQASLSCGLLLAGALYILHAGDIPRRIILVTVGLVTICLSLRRFVYRMLLHRDFKRGIGNRNVLIMGTGPDAQALRYSFDKFRQRGYTFKGFIGLPGTDSRDAAACGDVIGSVDTLFQEADRNFVDEIFVTAPCDRQILKDILEEAQIHGVDLRLVPDLHGGLLWNSPIEYIGQFITLPLNCSELAEGKLLIKRVLDIAVSSIALLFLAPLCAVIALAIKWDSKGPIFYLSERIGKKGRVRRFVPRATDFIQKVSILVRRRFNCHCS